MDRSSLKATDLDAIELNAGSDSLTVSFAAKEGDDVFSFEETIVFDKETPDYLKQATSDFVAAVVHAVHHKAARAGDVPCATCEGACCYKFSAVRVTADDVQRIINAKSESTAAQMVELYDGAKMREFEAGVVPTPSWTGHVGVMRYGDFEKSTGEKIQACVNLRKNGCAIYEHRPQVCREFSPWTCGDTYEKDLTKAATREKGRVTLRVLT